ncbi:MAG: 6-carboxytetrahydropterin synthase [Acidobacteriota bacterium]|nr:6-carboxytetrahydropterin synthase [Acidobacteriota bacterium]
MGWTVRCHATFEAAHHLVDYVGGPERVHGHSWKIEVALSVERLGDHDLSVDFVPTEAFVQDLAARLHNRDLNTVPPFDRKNASAENVALWVADEIVRAGLLKAGTRLEEVTVWEGTRNSVTYRP